MSTKESEIHAGRSSVYDGPGSGFGSKENGELLTLADGVFDVLVTIDKNIKYQQSMTGRSISILIIRAKTNDLSDIQLRIPDALAALASIQPGQIVEVG